MATWDGDFETIGRRRSNNRLKPTVPRVTPLAEKRKRRATRPAA